MTDDTDAVFVHIVHAGEQIERRIHVGDAAVVAELLAFDGDVGFRRPPVEHERNDADVA